MDQNNCLLLGSAVDGGHTLEVRKVGQRMGVLNWIPTQ